jgi:hypothetical protein
MESTFSAIEKANKLHVSAREHLDLANYGLAETKYRDGIDIMTAILDPLHVSYVDMLKGLLICVTKQGKNDEAEQVRGVISQLAFGQ